MSLQDVPLGDPTVCLQGDRVIHLVRPIGTDRRVQVRGYRRRSAASTASRCWVTRGPTPRRSGAGSSGVGWGITPTQPRQSGTNQDWVGPRGHDSRVNAEPVVVRALAAEDHDWVIETMTEQWGSTLVARLGELVDTSGLPGWVAVQDGARVGLALSARRADEYEVVSISATTRRRGVGRLLLARCVDEARNTGCRRIWLITTNNNVGALAFYQRQGLDLVRLHRHAMTVSRELKPSIPERDDAGLRIDHELELELLLR
jgi:ribosomal protein S18 acetylase RimI-like enzyme